MTADQRSVLVVGPSWVGDMVHAQAFFMALQDGPDDVAVDLVAPPAPFPLLERIPEIREAFLLETRHGRLDLGARWRLARRLRERRYDQAYVLPSSFKAALVPAFAGIPVRTAHLGEHRYGLINDVRPEVEATRDRNLRGYLGLIRPDVGDAEAIPRPRLRVDAENQRELVERLGLDPRARVVALAPGAAGGPAKRWPVESFEALAALLADQGRHVWVLGGPAEAALGEEIARRSNGAVRNLCGRTTLTDAVDLLAMVETTVANDSGLAHVAAAAGSPVVVLFGPTSPDFSAPLTDRSELVYLGLECSPCGKSTCPLGHHRCLRDIDVDEVARRVDRLGERGSGTSGNGSSRTAPGS